MYPRCTENNADRLSIWAVGRDIFGLKSVDLMNVVE